VGKWIHCRLPYVPAAQHSCRQTCQLLELASAVLLEPLVVLAVVELETVQLWAVVVVVVDSAVEAGFLLAVHSKADLHVAAVDYSCLLVVDWRSVQEVGLVTSEAARSEIAADVVLMANSLMVADSAGHPVGDMHLLTLIDPRIFFAGAALHSVFVYAV
jgi:hypothetical protein